MFDFLWNLGSFIVVLGVLITAHEYGHFYVARRCGVKVLRFSIGFGKPIWRRVGADGTEYVVAMIPLGGYVRMLDERIDDVPASERHMAFNQKSVYQRIAVVAAGPLANLLFAVLAFYLMLMIGTPSAKPVVGDVQPGSIAEQAGLQPEQLITAVDGKVVKDWEGLNLALAGRIGEQSTLRLQVRDLQTLRQEQLTLSLADWQFDPDKQSAPDSLGITLWRPAIDPVLSQVGGGSAGERAGLLAGDRLLAVDGTPLLSWADFVEYVQQRPELAFELSVSRQGAEQQLTVIPAARELSDGRLVGYLGVAPTSQPWPEEYRFEHRLGPLAALPGALDKTWQLVVLSVRMIGKLVTGDVALQHLSGPISIAQGAGMTAGFGLASFLGFMALISVNLGIINLLPLPVLDGGHLAYFLVELVRGRPVSEKAQEVGYRIGAMLLLALMSIAIFNDFMRL